MTSIEYVNIMVLSSIRRQKSALLSLQLVCTCRLFSDLFTETSILKDFATGFYYYTV